MAWTINKEYLEHRIFKTLADYAEFYDILSFTMGSFMSHGTQTILNFESHTFSSMKGTLDSISLTLKAGMINDSYALLRKYYDSVIVSGYVPAYLQEHFNIDNFIVKEIDDWVHGKMNLPSNRVMMPYLRNYPKLASVNALLEKDDRYKKLRNRCNDHMHFNSFYYLMINDRELHDENRIKFLNVLAKDLDNIFILHFMYTFTLNEHYMSSTDHSDYMDMGMEPPEDSQYYVAGFIQDIFDNYVKPNRMDLATELKSNTCMKLVL